MIDVAGVADQCLVEARTEQRSQLKSNFDVVAKISDRSNFVFSLSRI